MKKLEIELTGKCNLACVMCPQTFGDFDGRHLTLAEVERLLTCTGDYDMVTLHGGGELFLSPILPDVLNRIPLGKKFHFLTNATLLNEKNAALILKHAAKIDYFLVSIDAATQATYKKIRGASFQRTYRNLLNFKRMRDDMGLNKPVIYLDATIMKTNVEEMPQMVTLAATLDKHLILWPMSDDALHGGYRWKVRKNGWVFEYEKELLSDPAGQEAYAKNLKYAREIAGLLGVELETHLFYENQTPRPITECTVPSYNRAYLSNGEAKQCCWQNKALFDWRKEPHIRMEDHPRHQEVMRLIAAGKVPMECHQAGCTYVAGRDADEPIPEPFPVHWLDRTAEARAAFGKTAQPQKALAD